ncbi:(2Fe-2S) ferredoxin [Planobispora rosea]|uniref:cholesterol 7-desaturase n=1 Tax=Planobispora rosea TaxID=35762 RepID=A0A8J3S2J5_PLARO|nr:Rieske 2Fe-2S domain-containing protein [Planobispora rosea]GGS93561.1 (2Fe-2S) ferredoxin [Planobispora rosea]GIH87281.1 (2Fe-2S) ferredoxin [Planobispora rosea]
MTTSKPHTGWYLLCFDSELSGELTPYALGDRRLVVVRDGASVRVFDAICPHRGADLGYGGVYCGDAILCPFHGKRIALGAGDRRWSVAEHRVIRSGEAIFVRLGDDDRGFSSAVPSVTANRPLHAALTVEIAVDPEWVVENAFDTEHFPTVHGVPRISGMAVRTGAGGELSVEATFHTLGGPTWQRRVADTRFHATAFSPTVVATEIGAPGSEHVVITTTTPRPGGCVARVAIGVRDDQLAILDMLIAGSKTAFQQDIPIWEHLDPRAPQNYDGGDEAVVAFRRFVAEFGEA